MNIVSLSAGAQITITAVVLIFAGILPDGLVNIAWGVVVLSIPVYYFVILFWLKAVARNCKNDFGMYRVSTAFVAWIPLLGPIITYPFVYWNLQPYAP